MEYEQKPPDTTVHLYIKLLLLDDKCLQHLHILN